MQGEGYGVQDARCRVSDVRSAGHRDRIQGEECMRYWVGCQV